MPKAAIWALVGFGFLFLMFGLGLGQPALWVIGLLMMGGGLYIGLMPGGILRKESVFDTWSILIENGHGRGDYILKETREFIESSKAPNLKLERKAMSPGIIRGLAGETRDFLVATDVVNHRMTPFQIYLNARDYGTNLAADWHLTYRPATWQVLLSLIPYVDVIPKSLSNLDLFDQQDLTAYATNCHHCFLKSVEKLMVDLHQDPTKIDRKSRGFLGIS